MTSKFRFSIVLILSISITSSIGKITGKVMGYQDERAMGQVVVFQCTKSTFVMEHHP